MIRYEVQKKHVFPNGVERWVTIQMFRDEPSAQAYIDAVKEHYSITDFMIVMKDYSL